MFHRLTNSYPILRSSVSSLMKVDYPWIYGFVGGESRNAKNRVILAKFGSQNLRPPILGGIGVAPGAIFALFLVSDPLFSWILWILWSEAIILWIYIFMGEESRNHKNHVILAKFGSRNLLPPILGGIGVAPGAIFALFLAFDPLFSWILWILWSEVMILIKNMIPGWGVMNS